MNYRSLFVLSLLVLLFATAAIAQELTGSISESVYSEDGAPLLAGVTSQTPVDPVRISPDDQKKIKIAITFDDLPIVGRDLNIAEIGKVTEKLLKTLVQHNICSIGFVNEGKLRRADEYQPRRLLLQKWLDAGQELGNHTYSHPDYHKSEFLPYSEDIIRGEETLKEIQPAGREKWFRHPMLRNGNTAEKKTALKRFLTENGYTVAPVTIENDDYIFAAVYNRALAAEDVETAEMVKKEYLKHTEQMFVYFEGASHAIFDRQINHVLLLHANQLNADCMEEMVQMMLGRSYQFVTMAEALQDKAYLSPDNWLGNAGTNWLFRWDYSMNNPKKVKWQDQPVPSEEIMNRFNSIISGK